MALLVDSRYKLPIWKMFIRGLTIWVELLSFISILTSNFIEFLAPHFVGFTGIDDPYEPPLNCEVCIILLLLLLSFQKIVNSLLFSRNNFCSELLLLWLDWTTTKRRNSSYTTWDGGTSSFLYGEWRLFGSLVTVLAADNKKRLSRGNYRKCLGPSICFNHYMCFFDMINFKWYIYVHLVSRSIWCQMWYNYMLQS